jgi:hypothetical protein
VGIKRRNRSPNSSAPKETPGKADPQSAFQAWGEAGEACCEEHKTETTFGANEPRHWLSNSGEERAGTSEEGVGPQTPASWESRDETVHPTLLPLRKHQEKLTHNLLSKPGEKQEKLVVKNTRQKLHLGQVNQGPGSATPEKRGEGLVKKVLDLI